eukprot:353511-Chlamydomonas_euryale.AAC.6
MKADCVAKNSGELERHWRAQLRGTVPSLPAACWATVRGLFLAALPFKLVNDAAQFVGPVFLNLLLKVGLELSVVDCGVDSCFWSGRRTGSTSLRFPAHSLPFSPSHPSPLTPPSLLCARFDDTLLLHFLPHHLPISLTSTPTLFSHAGHCRPFRAGLEGLPVRSADADRQRHRPHDRPSVGARSRGWLGEGGLNHERSTCAQR